jgi:integrase
MKTKRNRFPIIVKRGSCAVKIYRDRKPSGTYFRVAYQIGGKRHRLSFSDLDKAKAEAEAKASQLSRGDVDAMQLTARDRLVYGRAVEAVREHGLPLDAAALEYSEARKMLEGVSVVEAARFYLRHHGPGIKRKSVADAVGEMIARKSGKISDLYLSDLRYRLGAFAGAFHCDLNALVPEDVLKFFDNLKLSQRSFDNFYRVLRTFFAYAQRHGWLSKEVDLLSRVEKPSKERKTPVTIFTPSECAALLKNAPPPLAFCLALSAFAGVRSEEILRLDWADVDRIPRYIEIAADKAKTATRRLVPISENLSKWLANAPRNGMRVWPHSKAWVFEAMRDAAGGAKIKWKQNALRHSFISYRLAETQDVNRVALEAGTSPQMIFNNYRELTTPDQARNWFSIAPQGVPNVVAFAMGEKQGF